MAEHEAANPQVAMLEPVGPSAKQIAKEVAKLVASGAAPHGEVISSLEYLAQIRGTIFTTTEGIPIISSAWRTANTAVYVPFVVRHSINIKQLRIANGATVTGNFDLGIYDVDSDALPKTRLVSAGSTAQSGTNDIQLVNVAVTLTAGLHYMAAAFSSTSATTMGFNAVVLTAFTLGDAIHSLDGVFEEASALPLPATATPVVLSDIQRVALMYVGRHQF